MKYKFFAVIVMCIMAMSSGILLSACANKYDNLSISVDKTEISLKIDDSEDSNSDDSAPQEEGEDDTTTLTLTAQLNATLNNADGIMSRGFEFEFSDPSIASAKVTKQNGDTSEITITGQTAGETTMRIISSEKGDVRSEPISIKVYRDAQEMVFNTAKAPSMSTGSTLELSSYELIDFYINGEKEKIYPYNATFSLMPVNDARWNPVYGNSIPNGITIDSNVLTATEDADCGIVQLLATMPSGLDVPVYVMVYKDLNPNQAISIQYNGEVVDEIKSIINPIESGANKVELLPAIQGTTQDFKFEILSNNTDIIMVGSPNSIGYFYGNVVNSGRTSIVVRAKLVDTVTGIVYKTFEKTYDVIVNKIVNQINLSGDDFSETSSPVDMVIQDVYIGDLLGARVHFDVFPKNEEHSQAISNTDVVLAVTEINGIAGEYTADSNFADVVVYVDDVRYVWGNPIHTDSDIYVALGEQTQVVSGFKLEFWANTYDPDLPIAKNYVNFSVEAGVKEILLSTASMQIAVGYTQSFTLSYETNLGLNQGSPEFHFNDADQNIYSIAEMVGQPYTYQVTALQEGDINIVITADSGATQSIALRVREVLTEFSLTLPNNASNVAEVVYNTENTEGTISDYGIKSFSIAINTSIEIGYNIEPKNISSLSFGIYMVTSTDGESNYMTVGSNFENKKLNIQARQTTELDNPVVILIHYKYYTLIDNELILSEGTRTISVAVYKPISKLYWSGQSSDNLNTDVEIYNINRLGLVDIDKGTVTLRLEYDSLATYFVRGNKIQWFVDDPTRVRIVEGTEAANAELTVSAYLLESDEASRYTVNVTARVEDFGHVFLLNCKIVITNPVNVSSIDILNYYDDFNGIRLNDLGITDRTSYELVTRVNPSNAFNTSLGYQIVDERGVEVLPEDAIITLDPDNPNIIRAVPGKSGETWIYIYPLDAYRSENTAITDIMHRTVHVVVEDGETNPYSIYEPAEFVAIGSSALAMQKNYILMNNIDLSSYSNILPLGEEYGSVFSGSITSASYADGEEGNARFIISGIPICNSSVGVDNNSYIGLFGQIVSTGQNPAISNIDFYFNNGQINLSNINTNIYAGLLAGRIVGNIENVYVAYANYRSSSLLITDLNDSHNLYFGAVAGELVAGDVANVNVDIALDFNNISATNTFIVGGIFGRFAGLSMGQDQSLMSNVYIDTQLDYTDISSDKITKILNNTSIYEGIGGIIGIAEAYEADDTSGATTSSSVVAEIRSMQVSGRIDALSTVNVGGLIGLNKVNLGTMADSADKITLYKNLSAVRTHGAGNVGGLVGANYGNIDYAIAEVYDIANEKNPDNLTWVSGLNAVGGLVGYNSADSAISYSYAMSYINAKNPDIADNIGRDMVTYGSNVGNTNAYYGDIIGASAVGGFVGYNEGRALYSFAFNRIQQIETGISEVDNLDRYAGGFAGVINTQNKIINYTFAIGEILSANPNPNTVGEYAGYYKDTTSNMVGEAYTLEFISQNDTAVYNFFGTYEQGTQVDSCFYVTNDEETNTSTLPGATAKEYESMRLDNKGSGDGATDIFRDAGWGFTDLNSESTKQQWVLYTDALKDVNKNLPILFDKDGNMLYNQAINDISVELHEVQQSGDTLPTFFPYRNPQTAQTLGLVVLLDNIPTDANNRKKVDLMDIDGAGLLGITVSPENLNQEPDKWTISVSSSDYSILEVVQPNQSLVGAYVIFKSCGVVTLTLRSLLNVNVYTTVEINVVGGFSEFNLYDSDGKDITSSDYIFYIKAGRDTGYSIYSQFTQKDDDEYITQKGLVYTTTQPDYVSFNNLSSQNGQIFIPQNMATIVTGVNITDEPITYSVAPYIELNFGGVTYKYTFGDLYKTFRLKVYEGISSVDVYTGKEANMPSGSDVIIKVTVTTDNVATTQIDDVFTLSRDNIEVNEADISRYAELIDTEVSRIATKNAFTLVVDGEEVVDRLSAGDIIDRLIKGESMNAYIEIGGVKYTTQSEIAKLEGYLLRDCVVNTYKLSLKGEDRLIQENTVFSIGFTVRDINGTEDDVYNVSDTITFTPANVVTVDLSHYTYGANSMEAGEVASKLLSPGTNGVLKIEISPYYAFFDYVLINNRALDTSTGIMMQQMVYRNGAYRYLQSSADYDQQGNMILRKVTGIDADGNEYFDGRLFVSTLITADTQEDCRYIVTVAPAREGQSAPVFEPIDIQLTSTFAPYATLSLDSEYTNNVVGRGTVANLRFTGTMQNSTLSFDSTYWGDISSTGSRLTNCAFDLRGIETSYLSGERERVDIIIPFYVGLLAKPDNGKITISITVRSRTNTGGELNPLIVTCTLSIVDYIVQEAYTNGTQMGNLQVSVNSYTSLYALLVRQEPKISDFEKFIGYSGDSILAAQEEADFETELENLEEKEQNKVRLINAMGRGDGGVWWYDNGTGFGQITTSHTYFDFLVIFDETLDQNCYKIRGRDLQTDFPLRLQFESYYIYNEDLGCYEFSISTDITDDNRGLLLDDYVRMLTQDFYSNITDQSDEDNPYAIDSAEALRTAMVEGGSYMLTADIELYNWVPLNVAIESLDGNGHVIYLRSFAQTVDTTTVNYGLFGTLSSGSVLKNLIVDVSYNIYINLQNIAKVNFGFIAGVNEGIIYNCDVVVTRSNADWRTIYNATTTMISSNADEQFGRAEFEKMLNNDEEYVGYNTIASTFIMTSKTVGNADVTTNIGGLVGQNASTGTITNSRVGRVDTENPLGTTALTSVGGGVYAQQGLNIFSSGNVGGLVGENSGVISNSYFANGYVVNSRMGATGSNTTNTARTGGLVANQTTSGRIIGSYARGQLEDGETRAVFGGVKAYGSIGGLVHTNAGMITNSYSNMNLTSGSGANIIGSGNGVGGFVYQNTSSGSITYCYSLSKVKTQGLINGMFIGIDPEGNLLDNENAIVENCFYLIEEGEIVDSAERAVGLVQESWQEPTGSAFEGFAISIDEDGENTWYIDANRAYLGPQLYLADTVFVSSRTTLGEVEGYQRGTKINPLTITSLKSWKEKIFNYRDDLHKSAYITATDPNSTKNANYTYGDAYIMLLVDIDFDGAIDEITSKTRFTGHLYGNGHIISGINFTQSVSDMTVPNDFGLFNSLSNATVTNLNLMIERELTSRASHVGVLAGSIYDSLIENVVITSSYSTAKVTGTNMVGALAGYISGDSRVYNVSSNLAVSANAAAIENREYSYYNPSVPYASSISYAGAIIGVLDLIETEDDNTVSPRVRNLQVKTTLRPANTRYTVTVDLAGEIVGGVVGLIGTNSEVYKAFFDIEANNNNMAIRGRNFAGGLIGENRGDLLNSRLSLADDIQMAQDSELLANSDTSAYVGYTSLFASAIDPNAIGGLVGLNIGGSIQYSYNRVAVKNTNANVAGGIIGLAINAPTSYTSTGEDTDPVLRYLQRINLNDFDFLSPVANGIQYHISSGTITPVGSDNISVGALLREVYTTGMVDARKVIGGLVGAQINAPIYTYSNSLVVGANNYNTRDSDFVSRINGTTGELLYIGSGTGYLGLNYDITPSENNVIAYIRDLESGVASQDMYLTQSIGAKAITPIGNVSGAMLDAVHNTSFISAATDPEDKPFENFDKNVWNLDNDKLAHRFPNLKIGYDSPVKDIHNEEEFFEEMVITRPNSHYRLVSDIVITGDRWEQFTLDNGTHSLGTDASPVRGRLEGAVSIISNGVSTTRPAKITFTQFNEKQMALFSSLFGYTSNFRLNNIDFIFDFDYSINAVSEGSLRDFALITLSSNSSVFNNITLSLKKSVDDGTRYTMTLDRQGQNTNIINIALFAATAHNSTFNNIKFDANVSIKNYQTSVDTRFTYGSLIGRATGNTNIGGVDQGSIRVEYQSASNYELYIGGLVGTSSGTINLSGSVNKTGNISGSLVVSTEGYLPAYIGGVVGNPIGGVILRNFTSKVNLTFNRQNSNIQAGVDYIGGIAGVLSRSNISGATTLGNINVNSGNGVLYLGGVAGRYVNSHTFGLNYSGYTTVSSSSACKMQVTGNAYTYVYIGGIYGYTVEEITMQNGLSAPMGDSVKVYEALYSTADIDVNVESAFIYAGGIIGNATQGVMVADEQDSNIYNYTELTTPNNVLRISGCGFAGDLLVTNNQMVDGVSYLGGITGYNNVMLQDVYSNGAISYSTQGSAPLYLGGITGFANNHIIGAMSLSIINVFRANQEANVSFVDPIVGDTLSTLEPKIVILIENAYYSPELNGIFGSVGYALSGQEVYDSVTADLIIANMSAWYYQPIKVNDDTTLYILIPQVLSGMVDWTIGSEIVPIVASDYDTIFSAMMDTTYIHKTIILANDISVAPQYYGSSLTSIRKIFGNGYSFVIDDYQFSNVNGDFGLYKLINRNVLISSLGIKFDIINLTATADSNVGVIAGVNYGTVFNVSIGGLPSIDTDYMGNTQVKTVADFGEGVANRYTSSILDSQEIATLKVNVGNTASTVGGMFGVNYGYITNSFSSIDLSISGDSAQGVAVGGIAGRMEWAEVNNIMNSGRLNLSTDATVGGLIGVANDSYIYGAICNVNMGLFSPSATATVSGLAFGEFTGGEYQGIAVNNDISATDFDNFDNQLYTQAFTTQEMASEQALEFVMNEDNLFDINLWSQDITQNYGYPVLNTITNISFATGDGSRDNPYQIAETSQLLSLKDARSVYYALTRDMVVSPQNYRESSQIMLMVTELNGLGHTIVVYGLPDIDVAEGEDEISLGLFDEISENTLVRNVGIAIVNDIEFDKAQRINYGGLVVKNYGTIANCYAISNDISNTNGAGTIQFTNSQPNSLIGGLVSQNFGDVTNSWCDVNIAGRDGYFGGIIGSLGRPDGVDEEGNVIKYKQATISSSFASGDITLTNMRANSGTSAGGIVGRNIASLDNGYVIQDCYVYGTKFIISSEGYYIGTILGYNDSTDALGRNIINTYRTYSYAAIPTVPEVDGGSVPTGNYLQMGMVGNQALLDECFDNTSSVVLYYYTEGTNTYPNSGERRGQSESDVATITTIGSNALGIGLRGTIMGQGIYTGWNGSNSPWGRNTSGVGSNVYVPYLNKVTPLDRQENLNSSLNANDIFGV